MIPVGCEDFQRENDRLSGPEYGVGDAGLVLPMDHPQAPLDDGVAELILPHRHGAIETKRGGVAMACRSHGSVAPADSGELVGLPTVHGPLIEPGYDHQPPHGRILGGHEEAMVHAGPHSGHRSAGIAADAVGNEPLELLSVAFRCDDTMAS